MASDKARAAIKAKMEGLPNWYDAKGETVMARQMLEAAAQVLDAIHAGMACDLNAPEDKPDQYRLVQASTTLRMLAKTSTRPADFRGVGKA